MYVQIGAHWTLAHTRARRDVSSLSRLLLLVHTSAQPPPRRHKCSHLGATAAHRRRALERTCSADPLSSGSGSDMMDRSLSTTHLQLAPPSTLAAAVIASGHSVVESRCRLRYTTAEECKAEQSTSDEFNLLATMNSS